MNVTALVNLLAGMVGMLVARPLIHRRVKMNPWCGLRVAQAFVSDAAWYAINEFGGRQLFGFSLVVTIVAIPGFFLPKSLWVGFNFFALVVVVVGLIVMISRIYAFARKFPDGPPLAKAGI